MQKVKDVERCFCSSRGLILVFEVGVEVRFVGCGRSSPERQAEKEAERVSRVCGLPISTYIRSQRCGCRAILIL